MGMSTNSWNDVSRGAGMRELKPGTPEELERQLLPGERVVVVMEVFVIRLSESTGVGIPTVRFYAAKDPGTANGPSHLV